MQLIYSRTRATLKSYLIMETSGLVFLGKPLTPYSNQNHNYNFELFP
jgi:hypothetical protein